MSKAIEAAVTAYMNADPAPTMADERQAMRAAIKAFLSALKEDPEVVERVARALASLPYGDVIVPDDVWANDYARAALSALEVE